MSSSTTRTGRALTTPAAPAPAAVATPLAAPAPTAASTPLAAAAPVSIPSAVGLLAGWGRYPLLVAEALKRQGAHVYCLGVRDHADPELARLADDFRWIGLAQLGGAIRYFRRQGVSRATMAGKIHKVVLYQPRVWLRHRPDLRAVRCFYHNFLLTRKDRRDDTLLGALVDEFARDGIRFAPATDFAPELLVRYGQLTRRGPAHAQRSDIEFGWKMAKAMGQLDIGQSVVVKDRAVLAVEAIEGTDACIRRTAALCPKGGFTVVKVAKPQQDMRFDVPTVGRGTLESMVAAGGRVLAIEAGRTIVLDEAEFLAYAEQHQLIVVALHAGADASVDPLPAAATT